MAAFYPTSRANEAAEAARTGLDELNAEAEAELTGSASDAVCGVGGIKDTDDRRPAGYHLLQLFLLKILLQI